MNRELCAGNNIMSALSPNFHCNAVQEIFVLNIFAWNSGPLYSGALGLYPPKPGHPVHPIATPLGKPHPRSLGGDKPLSIKFMSSFILKSIFECIFMHNACSSRMLSPQPEQIWLVVGGGAPDLVPGTAAASQ